MVNFEGEDPVEVTAKFTRGYGVDCAAICFGGDANAAFKQITRMMKKSPDTHTMGRVVAVAGSVSHGFGASSGNLGFRSSTRPGPGYHDEEWKRGRDYPPVFVQWTTKRNIDTSFSVTGGTCRRGVWLYARTTRLPARFRRKRCQLVLLNEQAVRFTTGWQPRSTHN